MRAVELLKVNLKAYGLLLSWLTRTQRRQLHTYGKFWVKGGSSKRTYEIDCGVYSYCTSVNGKSFCFQPASGNLPLADRILAMKLALENNEDDALRVANWRRPIFDCGEYYG